MPTRNPDSEPCRSNHNRLMFQLDKALFGYAAAAGAAGVGVLALAQPVEAKIIFTPSDIPIIQNGGPVQIDLNHDGTPDFSLYSVCFGAACSGNAAHHLRSPSGFTAFALTVSALQPSDGVAAITFQGKECAAEAGKGHKVGPGLNFQGGSLALDKGSFSSGFARASCEWEEGANNLAGFLGLKFVVNGQTYYGWAHLTFKDGPTLRGFAYDDTPNTPILTGATSGPVEKSAVDPLIPFSTAPALPSLGLLAKGAPGLAVWRRPEEELTAN